MARRPKKQAGAWNVPWYLVYVQMSTWYVPISSLFEHHGSGRVGSRFFQISRGRVASGHFFSNLTGRVRSGQEAMKSSRVRSGHGPRATGHSRVLKSRPGHLYPWTGLLIESVLVGSHVCVICLEIEEEQLYSFRARGD